MTPSVIQTFINDKEVEEGAVALSLLSEDMDVDKRGSRFNDKQREAAVETMSIDTVCNVADYEDWLAYPHGDDTKRFRASFDDVKSAGYVYNTTWNKGSVKSGRFTMQKVCAGVAKCPNCEYRTRPFVAKDSGSAY